MPELPEVETIRLGLMPQVVSQRINTLILYRSGLRLPFSNDLLAKLSGQTIHTISRRGKYLLFHLDKGYLLAHLGMTGHFKIVAHREAPGKHDHVDVVCDLNTIRFSDTRRFGMLLFITDPSEHPLLRHLGPEPLTPAFDAAYLYQKTRLSKRPIKNVLMDAHVVVGVGNIYANEALFRAQILPHKQAKELTHAHCEALVAETKQILNEAIAVGGTSFRNFKSVTGKLGYFVKALAVYGRKGKPCLRCGTSLQEIRLQGRSTVFCSRCQS